jgi:hypothetical protein
MAKVVSRMMQTMGLHRPRCVQIKYYELVVNPGPPSKRFILNWKVERDLRMRSHSPRTVQNDELIYEWKSGSMLFPDGYPWKNEGFVLHLKLVLAN